MDSPPDSLELFQTFKARLQIRFSGDFQVLVRCSQAFLLQPFLSSEGCYSFVPYVGFLMLAKSCETAEFFLTVYALIWLFPCVGPFMTFEQ